MGLCFSHIPHPFPIPPSATANAAPSSIAARATATITKATSTTVVKTSKPVGATSAGDIAAAAPAHPPMPYIAGSAAVSDAAKKDKVARKAPVVTAPVAAAAVPAARGSSKPRAAVSKDSAGAGAGAFGAVGAGGAAKNMAPSPPVGDDAHEEKGTMRIRAVSKPQLVAGAIANKLRDNEEMSLNGIGADSINQAVKSLCIARDYLVSESIDVHAWPTLLENVGPDVVSIKVVRAPTGWTVPAAPVPEVAAFKAAGGTKPNLLAGALAGKIREGEELLSVTSIGPTALLRSLKSIALAMSYAEGDGYEVSGLKAGAKLMSSPIKCANPPLSLPRKVFCVPQFIDLKIGEESRTGLCINIYAYFKQAVA